jgi:hypothetical protein
MADILGNVFDSGANVIDQIDGVMTNNAVDVLFKAMAVVGVLWALFFIPTTKKFSLWAAAILLFILLLSSSPTQNVSNLPASSTLPLPTQVNTPVPPPTGGSSGSSSGGSSGGGFNPLSLLPIIGSLFGL